MIKPLLLLFCSASLVIGQEAQDEAAKKSRTIKFKAVCVKFAKSNNETVKKIDLVSPSGEKKRIAPVTLALSEHAFSREIKYKGPSRVGLSLTGDDSPYFEFNIPEKGNEFLLVLIPSKTDSPYSVKCVALNEKDFPYGMRVFLNLGKNEVGLAYAKKRISIKPGQIQKCRMDIKDTGKKNFGVKFFEKYSTGEWKLFSSSAWGVKTTSRSFVFLYRNQANKHMTYHAVDDYYISPEALAKAKKVANQNAQRREQGLKDHPTGPFKGMTKSEVAKMTAGQKAEAVELWKMTQKIAQNQNTKTNEQSKKDPFKQHQHNQAVNKVSDTPPPLPEE